MYNPRMGLPLLWVSLAFMGGIAIAGVVHLHYLVWFFLGLLGIGLVVAVRRMLPDPIHVQLRGLHWSFPRQAALIALAAVAAASFGGVRYQLEIPAITGAQVSRYNDAGYEVLITGTLAEPPDVRDAYINLRLGAETLDDGSGEAEIRGMVLARVGPNREFHYGERLRLRGELLTPPSNEDFSYRDYLARQGIHSYMPSAEVTVLPGMGGHFLLRALYAIKEVSLRNVYRLFLEPEASLLAGILLGVDTGIPAAVEKAFDDTGTAHIIAISGFNIAIIAGVFAWVFSRVLGRFRGAIVTVVGIGLYAVFVGSDPPVLRAAAMGVVTLLAVQIGRRQVAVNTLAAVAAAMALANPFFLWDVGFQLSGMATLGLILYGGAFMNAAQTFFERHIHSLDLLRFVSPLGQFLVLTIAAELTTLPIIAYHFRQISVISPIANAFVLPAQPAVMVLSGLALVASLLVYPLGQLLAWVAWPLATYTIRVVELFAAVPHAVIYLGRLSLLSVAGFYAVLFAVTFFGDALKKSFAWLRGRFRYFTLTGVLVALFVCTLFAWRLAAAAPDGRLHVTFMDVGSADGILIETPSGGQVLVNGGPSSGKASDALGRRMSPLDRRLEWLVVAAADEHQVAALPRLIQRFPPRAVLFGAPEGASFSSAALLEELLADDISLERAEPGQSLDLGDGALLKVIDVSSRGSTLLLEWKTFRMLLPIGANLETLEELSYGEAVGPVSVLLLAQSGYGPLLPPDWLSNLHPQMVVISVASADKDGLPGAETMDALEGYPVVRTDQNGWIEVITDGSNMWVTSERD